MERRWRCPRCGREFRNRNQWHSCRIVSVGSHFEGKPANVREIYDALVAALEGRVGPIRIDAVAAGINFGGRAHFGGATPQRAALRVGFALARPVEHPRVVRREQVSSLLHVHAVKLAAPDDVDDELLNWFEEAFAVRGAERG